MNENTEQVAPSGVEIIEKTGQITVSPEKIRGSFNDVFEGHMERLLGTKQAIEGLPINLSMVSCFVLLANRETEIESFPYLPPPRYSREKLCEELAEINVESGEEIHSGIDEMIEKGYIDISDDGRYFAKNPTTSMVKLFDRIFPNMPGLNLVAYFGQMMDEVFSGRKTVKDAVDQFNQMLEIQGVPINKEDTEKKPMKKLFPHLKDGGALPKPKQERPSIVQIVKPSNIFSRLQTNTWASAGTKQVINPAPPSDCQEPACPVEESFDSEQLEHVKEDNLNDNPVDLTLQYTGAVRENVLEKHKSEPEIEEIEEKEFDTPGKSIHCDNIKTQVFQDPDDDDIEKMISHFEEKLGLTCPMCREAGIESRETSKGKSYYFCLNPDCNFISWGKPYYISCPQCENTFLIEALNSKGKTMLKCPRSTCHHWQEHPSEDREDSPASSPQTAISAEENVMPRKVKKRIRRVVRRKR